MRILLVETRVLIPTITLWFIGIPGEIEDNRKNLQAGWCPNSNRAKVANEKETRVRGRTAGFKTHHRSPILIYKDGWIAGRLWPSRVPARMKVNLLARRFSVAPGVARISFRSEAVRFWEQTWEQIKNKVSLLTSKVEES